MEFLFHDSKAIPIKKIKCNNIYKILVNKIKHKTQPFRTRNTDQYQITNENWESIYTLGFQLTICTKLRAFYWKLNHGLIYGNKQLHRFGIKENSNCHFCTTPLQTWQHIMIECSAIQTIWCMVEAEFSSIFNDRITDVEKELCAFDNDDTHTQKNLILLIVKQYIYKCNLDEVSPTWAGLIAKIRLLERVEYDIGCRKNSVESHFAKWEEILFCLSIGTPD